MQMFLYILFLVGFGALLVRLLKPESRVAEQVATGSLLGSGLLSLSHFALYLSTGSFHLSPWVPSLIFILTSLLLIPFQKLPKQIRLKKPIISKKKVDLLLISLIGFFSVSTLLVNTFWPVRDWDALTLYDFRAKIISVEDSLSSLADSDREYYHSYPLYTSQAHALFYKLDSSLSPMLFYSIHLLLFCFIFFLFLKDETNKTVALLFTASLLYAFDFSQHVFLAYTNLPFSIFLVLGILYLNRYVHKENTGDFFISALFFALTSWVRFSEPFWILGIILASLAVLQRGKKKSISSFFMVVVFAAVAFIFRLPWSAYKQGVIGSVNEVGSLGLPTELLTHSAMLLSYLWRFLVEPYSLFFFLLCLSAFLNITAKGKKHYFLLVSILGLIGTIVSGTVLLSLFYEKWIKVGGSLTRMSIFLIPIILYYCATILFERRKLLK